MKMMNEAKSKFVVQPICSRPLPEMIIGPRIIRASIGDDPKFIREVAAGFLPSAYADIENISQAVSDQDAEGIRAGTHGLKGLSVIFGANDLKHVCTALESATRNIDWDLIRAVVPKLTASLAEIEVAIEAFLERIR